MQKIFVLLTVFINCIVCLTFGQISSELTPQQYIDKYHEWAILNMKRSGVPASITLAQGMLESGNGNSRLAVEANNHFGIKCHDWTGEKVYHHDDRRNECFRKYNTVYDSYADHAQFLSTRSRYAFLFDLDITDYKGWARGLKKAGYATDPNYAKRLIDIIERYKLYEFDREGAGRSAWKRSKGTSTSGRHVIDPYTRHEVLFNNGVRYIKVKPEDTFSSIAQEFNLRDWELPKYNDLKSAGKATDYNYLYIEPKRNKAHPDHPWHVVKEGESMFEISQIYGIKLRKLYKLNNMNEGEEAKPGERLSLRKKVKN
ncbi:glucosaminidase domain-containing protein [Thermophagus xiamenensis]|uniref:Peptidoglycan hydrolase n=1 Tax=Thermophagus xiamenensis TaxID=385682 RepID=A0A1I1VFN1_9BACT|nr:glucosaminidase domain-containing protein [Thermophagus xiamenensis]SFD81807.1 Flagellum-specific peptidoglycan hydrolase FlgJ [Thermophagus xiamenensis]